MKVLVCGGRDFDDYDLLGQVLGMLNFEETVFEIIEGGARGADSLAREWAAHMRIPCKTIKADWDTHGKAAGIKRNLVMLEEKPDIVVAFPGGRGTDHMITAARKRGFATLDVRPWGGDNEGS